MNGKALIIGNSDGIGLATTRELLKRGWKVVGISRSESPIEDPSYEHVVARVQDDEYPTRLKSVLEKSDPIDLSLFCAGIGEMLDLSDMGGEAEIVDVNLIGMVKTASSLIPLKVKRGEGHFIGLSSVADEMLSPEAPSYLQKIFGFHVL